MNPERPDFNIEPQKETKKSEKEILWDKTRKEVDEIGDRLSLGIDEGIKETVTAFQVNELPTSSSCEGHIDRGIPVPYVEVSAPNEPKERFVRQEETFARIAKKYNLTIEEINGALFDAQDAYWEAIRECSQNGETEEYKKWDEKNKKLQVNAKNLLKGFYREKRVEPNVKLQIYEIVGGFRVHNGGEDYQPIIEEKEFSEKEKKERAKKLSVYKKEMDEFTEFLKSKYFSK